MEQFDFNSPLSSQEIAIWETAMAKARILYSDIQEQIQFDDATIEQCCLAALRA